jgi:hypothetical protein
VQIFCADCAAGLQTNGIIRDINPTLVTTLKFLIDNHYWHTDYLIASSAFYSLSRYH